MLLVSLQWIGGLAPGATPFANGPRHCGQASDGVAQPLAPSGSASAGKVNRHAKPITRNRYLILITLCTFDAKSVKVCSVTMNSAFLGRVGSRLGVDPNILDSAALPCG